MWRPGSGGESGVATVDARSEGLSAEASRRLAGLCRLWGAVKYFHPSLAYRGINWDAALVETIPHILAAESAGDYRNGVDHLLARLRDPNTRTLAPEGAAGPSRPAEESRAQGDLAVHHTADGIAVVVATDYTRFQAGGPDAAWDAVLGQARRARAAVFDLRRLRGDEGAAWQAQRAFAGAATWLIAEPLFAAGTRHRMHAGHRQQRGPLHGGYASALVYEQGHVVLPAAPGLPRRPLGFVVNAESAHVHPILAGMQAAGLASVVQEGAADWEPGVPTHRTALADGVQALLRLGELVSPDGSLGFRPDAVVPASPETAWDASPAVAAALEAVRRGPPVAAAAAPAGAVVGTAAYERDYPEMTAPALPYRLLALFRFWNAIHHFFPYKHLLDRSWDDVLLDHLPHFAREGDAEDYALCVSRLAAETCDTHAFVNAAALRRYLGTHGPPVYVREIQGESVVTHLLDLRAAGGSRPAGDTGDIAVGDVVVAVDGEPAVARRARLAPLLAASTPQALRWRLDRVLLTGAEDSPTILTVRGAAGAVRDVTLARSVPWPQRPRRTLPVFGVLPEGVGYVDLERLTVPQVDEAFDLVRDTPALIFDLRGYPNGTAWPIAPRLTATEVVTARFRTVELHRPDVERRGERHDHQTAAPSPKWRYAGRVAVLINEEAISQSEHTCLFLEAAADVTFIGSPTNGANGNVTNVVLPGGVSVGFSGMEVTHADGRQLQRLGIQPHIRVEPTIAGVRAGRDEELEAAIAFLAAR